MSIVAEFDVPAEAFCLGEALGAAPDATVTLDRVVAHSPDHVMPFVWVIDVERGAFDAAVADDPTVESAEAVDTFGETHLYQFEWADVVSDRLHTVLDHDGVIMDASGTGDEWRLSVRFGSREHFSTFREHFGRFGEVTLHRISTPQTPGGIRYGVSTRQREALLAAYEAGYYDTPSAVTGEELAQGLGVTQQSVSRLLRRGTNALIENTLVAHREVG